MRKMDGKKHYAENDKILKTGKNGHVAKATVGQNGLK